MAAMPRLELTPEQFRQLAMQVSEMTTDYLQKLPSMKAFPRAATGARTEEMFGGEAPEAGLGAEAFGSLRDVFAMSRPGTPGFFGYVFGSGEPVAALGDFAASVVNQNVTAWRSGPAAVTIERTVIRWLAEALGCKGFSGSLTGGGSPANLMGLCMAREAKCPANDGGAQGGLIYTSSEAHMSIPKAAALLGLGRKNLRMIPVDERFRMRMDALADAIQRDVTVGLKPMAVVASAGTVTTGSIDPLEEIADLCQRHGLWMHVDGAYGALAALAEPAKFRGLDRCDSMSLDPHKWLYQPADCGCLLYRDAAAARKAFSFTGDYVRSLTDDPVEGFAFFEESMELSRRFRALKLWLSLRYHGMKAFRESIAEDLRLAQVLKDAVAAEPKLELMAPVELSAVCFRYSAAQGDLNGLNAAILKEVIRRGRIYISNATIDGKFALRACIVNHRSTEADVKAVVSEVVAAAAGL